MFPRPVTPSGELERAGGAYVRRRFAFGEREVKMGDTLSREDLDSIPINNLRSLIQTNLIELYPSAPPKGECFLMPAEDGKKFHIVQGTQVTDEPLSRAAAQAKIKELTA